MKEALKTVRSCVVEPCQRLRREHAKDPFPSKATTMGSGSLQRASLLRRLSKTLSGLLLMGAAHGGFKEECLASLPESWPCSSLRCPSEGLDSTCNPENAGKRGFSSCEKPFLGATLGLGSHIVSFPLKLSERFFSEKLGWPHRAPEIELTTTMQFLMRYGGLAKHSGEGSDMLLSSVLHQRLQELWSWRLDILCEKSVVNCR